MKTIYTGILISLMLLVAAPAMASSFPSFNQEIDVGATGTLTIQETVEVNFTNNRHGIYRDIPVNYKTSAGNPFSLRVAVVSVTDENGQKLDYSTSRNGKNFRIKIGNPDVFITGANTYIITYTADRVLLFMEDHDELYWNVATEAWGDLGWPEKVSATVALPKEGQSADIRMRCFTGLGADAPEDCVKSAFLGRAEFSTAGTPLTIVVGWPKNIVTKPALIDELVAWAQDNWIIFIPIITFIAMFALWYKKGRDPKPKGPMVVQYDPPDNASPAEVGVLFDQRTNAQEITATIIHLAVKGYLDIVESTEKGLFGSKQKYSFGLKKSADGSLAEYEQEILNGLFGAGAIPGAQVDLSDLQKKFHKVSTLARKQMADATVKRGWFAKNPTTVRASYMGVGTTYCFVMFWLFSEMLNGPVSFISLLLPGVIVAGFGFFMPARTGKGTVAYAHVLGFKEYLSKAETYRLKWEEKENIFQIFLPYAMVFGVVDKWAKAFEGIDMQPPSWYHGSNMAVWTPLMFAHTLNAATSSIGQALTVAPSARGGGGFSGGVGGGGFGGGGGGSW